MPYGRKYNNRRSNRRYHKRYYKFSKSSTYRNRSARAQARQIYALNKKIDYVRKMNKPEIQIYESTISPINAEVTTDVLYGRSFELHRCIDQSLGIFNGRYARIKNVTFTGDFKFNGNPATAAQEQVGCLRLVFFRPVNQIWGIPSVDDVFIRNNDYTNEYYMRCPLKHGFATKFKLVGDYKFYLFPQKQSVKFVNIKLNYPYSLRRDQPLEDDSQLNFAFPANSLFCVSFICRTGESTNIDTFTSELFMKLAYTDDSFSLNVTEGGAKTVKDNTVKDNTVEDNTVKDSTDLNV